MLKNGYYENSKFFVLSKDDKLFVYPIGGNYGMFFNSFESAKRCLKDELLWEIDIKERRIEILEIINQIKYKINMN